MVSINFLKKFKKKKQQKKEVFTSFYLFLILFNGLQA